MGYFYGTGGCNGSMEKLGEKGVRIAHLFADQGTEVETLSKYGQVHRFTLNPQPNEYDHRVESMDLSTEMPSGDYDLALLHPPCTKWSTMPGVNPDDHPDLIDRARTIGREIADHYIIENKPKAPLNTTAVLNGQMFGLPIEYERAFETSFPVTQPPRHKRLTESAETSPFFYSERTETWWKSVKGVRGDYPKEHVAKNTTPAAYLDHVLRAWMEATKQSEGVRDYSNYDAEMDAKRAADVNQSLEGFADAE